MKNVKKINIFNLCFFVFMIIADACYLFVPASEYITKTIASVAFVLGGAINLIYALKHPHSHDENKNFKWWMLVGLIFACLGDIFLIDFFIIGVAFFALGHVFYFISFTSIQKICLRDLFISIAIFIPSTILILFYKGFDFKGMQAVILIYALVISFMMGKSISNYMGVKSRANLVVMLGSIAFFISDFILMFRLFAGWGRVGSILCLAFYYPAQFMLAWSIEVVSRKSIKE